MHTPTAYTACKSSAQHPRAQCATATRSYRRTCTVWLAWTLMALHVSLPPALAQSLEHYRLAVQGSGQVEVYINGHYIGRSAEASRLELYARHLQAGENVIALRASKGGNAAPFVMAELGGDIGRLGTSPLWRVQSMPADLGWTLPGFDASSWPQASVVTAVPPAGFPTGGPALGVWSATAADSTIALRAHVWMPTGSARLPQGFARNTTGGAGGEVVTVDTREALAAALCSSMQGNACTDDTPRIIRLAGTIDFTGSEGSATRPGCNYSSCPAPLANERLVLLNPQDTHCDGKPVFDITYDAAGNNPLRVGSNKTLVGVGNDAVLRGKGLRISNGADNVIIRNITIEHINNGIIFVGDAISINDATRVWIDHNRFNRIGRQFIVTGYGAATDVTISWNDFDGRNEVSHYCDGRHYWNLLLLGNGDEIGLYNNWIRHFSGRAPHAGAGGDHMSLLHVAGNLFEDGYWHALDIGQPVRALVEGNTFHTVSVPILDGGDPGFVWADKQPPTAGHQALCGQWLGRPCAGNPLVEQPQGWDDNFRSDLIVLGDFSSHSDTLDRPGPEPAQAAALMVPFLAGPGHLGNGQIVLHDVVFNNGFEP